MVLAETQKLGWGIYIYYDYDSYLYFIISIFHIHIQVQDPAHGLDPISSVTIDTNTFSKRRTFDLININTVALFVDFILEFQQRFLQLAVTFSSLTSNIECKGNGSDNENATSAVIATPPTWTHDSYRCHNCREDISRYRVV